MNVHVVVVSTSAINWPERHVSKMTCYVLSVTSHCARSSKTAHYSNILVVTQNACILFKCRCYSTHSQVADRQEGNSAGTVNGVLAIGCSFHHSSAVGTWRLCWFSVCLRGVVRVCVCY